MPRRAKRTARRRGRRRRPFTKSVGKKGEVMVNRMPARLHTAIAPHYYTRLEAGFSGNVPAGSGPQTYFGVWGNGLKEPFHSAPIGLTVASKDFTSAAAGPAGVLVPATLALAALYPVGFKDLSYLYGRYRVFASKIDVTVTPTAGADGTLLTVVPVPLDSNLATATDSQLLMSLPYSKSITVTGNNNVKMNRVSMFMDAPTALGLTKQQYKDSDATNGLTDVSGGGGNPTQSFSYLVNLNQLSGAALTAIMIVEVRVTYWVEFYQNAVADDS